MKNLNKLVLSLGLALTLTACSSANADENSLGSMAGQNVNTNEIYSQVKTDSQGQGFFDVIDAQLLSANYSYEKNKKVKEAVDKTVKEYKDSNPDILATFDAKTDLEMAQRSGLLLDAQREQYTKDQYNKQFVTDASLKDLYNKRAGEMISYTVIELDETLFDQSDEKLQEAIKKIKEQLKDVKAENATTTFATLAKDYPGDKESIVNGVKESVDREQVDETILKKLDSMKYQEFTKDPVEVDGKYYFLYKSSKDERLSFDASKERLRDLQYENATSANQYLSDHLLLNLRKGAKVSFPNATDKAVYDAALAQITKNYNEAAKGENN